jgi:hypothetical protein
MCNHNHYLIAEHFIISKIAPSGVWWYISVIPALRRLRQED